MTEEYGDDDTTPVTFDPKLIAKYQRRFPDFDDKIISMYARGMTVREICGHLEELYGIDVSPDLVSAITDAVLEEVAEWQNRPLDACYGISQMHAHLGPATSFLRLHKPEKFGDDMSKLRPALVQVNTSKKPVRGIEIGVFGIPVRGLVPVFYEGKHVGSFETGSFIDSAFLKSVIQPGERLRILMAKDGKFAVAAASDESKEAGVDAAILNDAIKGTPATEMLSVKGKSYAAEYVPLHDWRGEPTSKTSEHRPDVSDGVDGPLHRHRDVPWWMIWAHQKEGTVHMKIATIGLDIAKNVFQVHGVDDEGRPVLRRKVRRDKLLMLFEGIAPCVVGMEACATAHHWARQLVALGHEVRLMPPAYVKAYVKRNKNDAADAEAICEAVTRPTMRFVPIKSPDAQSVLMLHRSRHLLVRQRTAQISALRAHMAEYGFVAPKGKGHVRDLAAVLESEPEGIPDLARRTLFLIVQMIESLSEQIRRIEIELLAWHRENTISRRLETIPGIGFITATALVATVGDANVFRSGRQFAAWLGLVPRQNSSGGKERLGGISKMGDRYVRHLLVIGATAIVRYTRRKETVVSIWANRLLERKPPRLVTVAVANKMARIAWAVMARGEPYRATSKTA